MINKINLSTDRVLSNIIDKNDGGYTMPRPEYRPSKIPKKRLSQKIILKENVYVDALSSIIERDYFPYTAKLRKHLELLHAYDNNDAPTINALHQQLMTEQRRGYTPNQGSSPSSSSTQRISQQIPLSINDDRENNNSTSSNTGIDNSVSVPIENLDRLTVNDFFREYTSEDNESFEILQEKDLEKFRRDRHWAYEIRNDKGEIDDKKSSLLMLYYMNNKVLTGEERAKFDSLLALPNAIGDDRPNNVDTWRFRVRNQLMFTPSSSMQQSQADIESMQTDNDKGLRQKEEGGLGIESTSSTHKMHEIIKTCNCSIISNEVSLKQINNQMISKRNIALKSNKWVGENMRPQKLIQRNNTSLRVSATPATAFLSSSSSSSSGITPSPLEPPHTPSVQSESFSVSSASEKGEELDSERRRSSSVANKYKIVSMTPSPMPGSAGLSPLMTWGMIGGTPLILDPNPNSSSLMMSYSQSMLSAGISSSTGSEVSTGAMYQPPAAKRRELLAHELDARGKARIIATNNNHVSNQMASQRSGLSRAGSSSSSRQHQHHKQQLTPAALSLAQRLSGGASDVRGRATFNPFGGTLAESYSHNHKKNKRRRSEGAGSVSGTPRIDLNTDNLF